MKLLSKLVKVLGYKYLINLNPKSKKIHMIATSKNCMIELMTYWDYLTERGKNRYLKKGYQMCTKCNK